MKKTVLIVDDESIIIEILYEFLEILGFHVIISYNGKDALEKFQTEKIDFIITDIYMPEMDGTSLIKEIRKTDKDIIIIALSGYIENERIREIMDIGANEYIEKPFSISHIKNALEKFKLL